MMKSLLLAAALAMLAEGAVAQNTNGTGAESRTTTTTKPWPTRSCLSRLRASIGRGPVRTLWMRPSRPAGRDCVPC
jgi:hypothetical protein